MRIANYFAADEGKKMWNLYFTFSNFHEKIILIFCLKRNFLKTLLLEALLQTSDLDLLSDLLYLGYKFILSSSWKQSLFI